MKIRNVKESALEIIIHGSEINLISMNFYRTRRWQINTRHEWKIRAAAARATK